VLDVRIFCRVAVRIALPGVLSAAFFAFLASFDKLLISIFLASVRAQTLPVRIWNSLNLKVEPTITAVGAFLIGVTTLTLSIGAVLPPERDKGADNRTSPCSSYGDTFPPSEEAEAQRTLLGLCAITLR
jgi:ABC-type spermidine/putrescine transport system permease subunit II